MQRVRLPLYGPARAEGPLGPLPLRRKALAILYYLALEGPTRREKLADLLWGHGAALQNLRTELSHLRAFLGSDAFRGQVLALPPGVELDRTPGGEEILEGLESVSPSLGDWVQMVRARLGVPKESLPLPERLKEVRPPALVVLIGPPGSGRGTLARSLAERLRLPFREGLGQGPGVYYLSDPLPPKEEAFRLKPVPGQVLVVARSLFGEDPSFLLALRARFPAEMTWVVQVPRLGFAEARATLLRSEPFHRAARFYLASGGRLEVMKELLALGDPEAFPQRIRAMVVLEARYLSREGRRALEALSLHPGAFPAALAEGLGLAGFLDELEYQGWLTLSGGRYRFAEPQFRRYLEAQLSLGKRLRIHRQMAGIFHELGDVVAELYHRDRASEPLREPGLVKNLREWRRVVVDSQFPWSEFPPPSVLLGFGSRLLLDLPEVVQLVSLGGEPTEVPLVLEERAVLRLTGRVYQELPLGLGSDSQAFPLRLMGEERGIYFLPTPIKAGLFWGTVLPEDPLDYAFLLPPGVYRLGLGTRGLAELQLQAHRPAPGSARVLTPLGQVVEV
ncbi:hypothetical protein [Thermus altitudinis]|uniref:hypothetical protein n=1 Tax=Thermus altitudinis TaxID=2908145 RepID=UPI001FAAE2F3|nr:hypothetical protein [Thermus altitudinis]